MECHKSLEPTNKLDNKTLDIGDSDISMPTIFHSTNRHADVAAEDLSELWCISLKKVQETLNKTTQKLLCSALLPLSRHY